MSLSLRPDPFLVPKEFKDWGTSLVVQWLRLRASTAGGMGVILGQGAKILHAAREARPKKKSHSEDWDEVNWRRNNTEKDWKAT